MLDKRLHIKISKDHYHWIKDRSSAKNVSMGEFVRELVDYSIKNNHCHSCGVKQIGAFAHKKDCPESPYNNPIAYLYNNKAVKSQVDKFLKNQD